MNKALTKADIIETVYNHSELSLNRSEVKNVIENMLQMMKRAIKKDEALLISGFGKFEAYDKNARKGRNPQTDESITLPPRKVVVFRLSRKFRAELNGEQA
ncbi:integration host factor subunit alpha [uncultured Mailhella sp.]|uniref:integration host factor subunit alpha n=1 Tax=uncultured Mailhella sp. TaxID=1981031 RepID=UPI00260E52D3|nr:integration host factor subunit alpha [uncultured Mailhella sp.]